MFDCCLAARGGWSLCCPAPMWCISGVFLSSGWSQPGGVHCDKRHQCMPAEVGSYMYSDTNNHLFHYSAVQPTQSAATGPISWKRTTATTRVPVTATASASTASVDPSHRHLTGIFVHTIQSHTKHLLSFFSSYTFHLSQTLALSTIYFITTQNYRVSQK